MRCWVIVIIDRAVVGKTVQPPRVMPWDSVLPPVVSLDVGAVFGWPLDDRGSVVKGRWVRGCFSVEIECGCMHSGMVRALVRRNKGVGDSTPHITVASVSVRVRGMGGVSLANGYLHFT